MAKEILANGSTHRFGQSDLPPGVKPSTKFADAIERLAKEREKTMTQTATEKVARTTVAVWEIDCNQAYAMYEQGRSYSFNPCKDYHDRNYNVDCTPMQADLSENFRLVTVKVWSDADKPTNEIFAVKHDDANVPTEAIENFGCYYAVDGKTLLENLWDADKCMRSKVLTNIRSVE